MSSLSLRIKSRIAGRKRSAGTTAGGDGSSARNSDVANTKQLLAHSTNATQQDDPDSHSDSQRHGVVSKPPRTDGNTPHLLGIPNEIRNIIYHHLLSDLVCETREFRWPLTRPSGSISLGRTPNFLRICTKLCNNCMPMFLSRFDFVVDVSPKNLPQPAGYIHAIATLTRLGVNNVCRIKTITILNNDFGRSYLKVDTDRFISLIEHWNRFIPSLLATGVRSHQLRWPGLCVTGNFGGSAGYGCGGQILGTALLYLAVVEPTLRQFDCLSPQHLLSNVLKQAFDLKFLDSCDKHSFRDDIAKGWMVVNNRRWRLKYGVAADPKHFEDLDRGPGKQSYILGQKNDPYRDSQHSWHA